MDLGKMLYYETVGNLINKKELLHFDMNDVANSLSISIDRLIKNSPNKEELLVY
ncbi:MAG: hypothetical protein ACJAZ3_000390 [Sphingobacteriales bacterium]|jgi:hypothetical protein